MATQCLEEKARWLIRVGLGRETAVQVLRAWQQAPGLMYVKATDMRNALLGKHADTFIGFFVGAGAERSAIEILISLLECERTPSAGAGAGPPDIAQGLLSSLQGLSVSSSSNSGFGGGGGGGGRHSGNGSYGGGGSSGHDAAGYRLTKGPVLSERPKEAFATRLSVMNTEFSREEMAALMRHGELGGIVERRSPSELRVLAVAREEGRLGNFLRVVTSSAPHVQGRGQAATVSEDRNFPFGNMRTTREEAIDYVHGATAEVKVYKLSQRVKEQYLKAPFTPSQMSDDPEGAVATPCSSSRSDRSEGR